MGSPEPEGRSRNEQGPPNTRLFPVGDAAVVKTFAQIARYKNHAHFTDAERSEVKKFKNENLYAFFLWSSGYYLSKTRRLGSTEQELFMKGTMVVHNALRNQNQTEYQIPILTITDEQNDINDIFNRERTTIKKFAFENGIKEDADNALEIIAQTRIKQMTNESGGDQTLGKALLQYADSHPGGNAFLVGAMFAYFPIKRLYLEREIEKADHEITTLKDQETRSATQAARRRLDHWDMEHPELDDLARKIEVSLPIDPRVPDRADVTQLIEDVEAFLGKQP